MTFYDFPERIPGISVIRTLSFNVIHLSYHSLRVGRVVSLDEVESTGPITVRGIGEQVAIGKEHDRQLRGTPSEAVT